MAPDNIEVAASRRLAAFTPARSRCPVGGHHARHGVDDSAPMRRLAVAVIAPIATLAALVWSWRSEGFDERPAVDQAAAAARLTACRSWSLRWRLFPSIDGRASSANLHGNATVQRGSGEEGCVIEPDTKRHPLWVRRPLIKGQRFRTSPDTRWQLTTKHPGQEGTSHDALRIETCFRNSIRCPRGGSGIHLGIGRTF